MLALLLGLATIHPTLPHQATMLAMLSPSLGKERNRHETEPTEPTEPGPQEIEPTEPTEPSPQEIEPTEPTESPRTREREKGRKAKKGKQGKQGKQGKTEVPNEEDPSTVETPPPKIFGEEIDLDTVGMVGDIHPIQVVQRGGKAMDEKVPLVAEKRTIVRVYVNLPLGKTSMKDVTCTLRWWGDGVAEAEQKLTADLLAKGNDTLVQRQMPGRPDSFSGPGSDAAYNFMFADRSPARGTGGRPAPTKTLILQAELTDKNGNRLGLLNEKSGDTFQIVTNKQKFNVAVITLTWNGSKNFAGTNGTVPAKMLAETEEEVRNGILGVYPIADVNLVTKSIDGGNRTTIGSVSESSLDVLGLSLATDSAYSSYDAIVVRTTIIPGKWGGYNPLGQDRVAVWWRKSPNVIAHEVGHAGRFLGGGHRTESNADGWDAGRHWRVSRPNRTGKLNLMQESPVGLGWISEAEYEVLLKDLTK